MSKNKFSWDLFHKMPIVGIIRNVDAEDVKTILPICIETGLTTVEITMNTPGASNMIREAIEQHEGKLNIGAGTVCNKIDLEEALNAGSQFIVTPIIDKKVIKSCVKKGVPIFPGAYTPSEIYRAWSLGAPMIKIYPATSLGPEYIKDVKAPLNNIKLLPTGGVSLQNLVDFKKAGADGFGIGSQLFDKSLIKNKKWDELKAHIQQFTSRFAD